MSKVKKKLKNYQYEYFLKELETLSNYRAQFSNSRLLILGGSITLLIAIAQLTEHDKYGQVIIAHIMIAGIMVTVVKMIASYSAAIYIFFDYIKALEKKFGLAGFSNAWEMYLSNNKLDNNQFNATNSCFIACTVMIILSCIYTLSTIGSLTIHNSYKITNIFCYYIIALYALVFLLYYIILGFFFKF